MSEFIGSRISLVSKSDIRYVGTLTEINSESSTVALENVQSFGTEGRKQNPDEELGPSDTVFEYIVFRGSDVKDLRIEEPPKENKPPQSQVPNDPAILGSGSRPGHAGSSERSANDHRPQHPQFPQPQQYSYPPQHRPFPPHHGFGGFSGGFPGQYGPPPGWFPQPGRPFPEQPPNNFSPHGQHSMMFGGPQFPNQPRSSGSELERQFRPPPQEVPGVSATYQKPSPADAPDARPEVLMGPTNNTDGPRQSVSDDQPLQARSQTGGPESKPSNSQGTDDDANITSQRNRPTKVVPALPKQTITRRAHPPAQPVAGSTSAGGQVAATAALQYQNATQAATAAVAAAMAKLPQLPTQKTTVQAEDKKVDVLAKQVSEMRTEDRTRNPRPPLPGTHGGLNRGRGARRGPRGGGKGIDVPSSDFDFESANAQFSKEDLVKEAIATGSPLDETSTPAEPTGESAPDRAADSSEVVIPPALVYQRSSFFDNISSEAKEREDAGDNRRRGPELRIEERRRNYETFGLGSVDGGHRGGYRGRNRGRGMRGGSMRGREGPRHRGRGFAFSD